MSKKIKVEIHESKARNNWTYEPLWFVVIKDGDKEIQLDGYYNTYANAAMDAHIEVTKIQEARENETF